MKNKLFRLRIFGATLITCAMWLYSVPAHAQEETEEDLVAESATSASQSFSFVYVAQDASMPVQEIENKLQTAKNRALMEGPTIFYLSRGMEEPIIVKVNVEGDDNRDDFEDKLLPSINQDIAYSVDGARDKQRIIDELQLNKFVSEDGTPLYKETNFEFHVGQDFWTANNNEIVIAALFFELNIKKYVTEEFHFNVFCPRSISYNEDDGPFGILNPDDCRRYINLDRSY